MRTLNNNRSVHYIVPCIPTCNVRTLEVSGHRLACRYFFFFYLSKETGMVPRDLPAQAWPVSSKGTEEHNSAAENMWKEPPSFYTQAPYVSTTNTVIYRLIFSQSVWVGMSFYLYFIVEAHSTRSYPQPISLRTRGPDLQMPPIEAKQDGIFRPD